jgi:hypothetical protein
MDMFPTSVWCGDALVSADRAVCLLVPPIHLRLDLKRAVVSPAHILMGPLGLCSHERLPVQLNPWHKSSTLFAPAKVLESAMHQQTAVKFFIEALLAFVTGPQGIKCTRIAECVCVCVWVSVYVCVTQGSRLLMVGLVAGWRA